MTMTKIKFPYVDGMTGYSDIDVDIPDPSGPVDALAYFDDTGALTGDALLTALPLDPQQRPQIHDTRLGPTLRGPIWRQGAWEADGDPTNSVGEGFLAYGANALGLGPDATEGGYGFVTPYSFGRYQIIPGVNGGNVFLTCGFEDGSINAPFGYNGFQVTDNLNNILLKIDRATFNTLIGSEGQQSELFINAPGALHGSNAGIQQSSTTANRAGMRNNQYGNNTGVPGVTGFKSRGTNIGDLLSVNIGDILWRATAIGVAQDNASIPLAAFISIIAAGPLGANYVPSNFQIQLTPLAGPINTRKEVLLIDSEGVFHIRETANAMAGLAILDAAGTALIANNRVTATTKFNLTAQDGGAALTGSLQQSARVAGASFTIRSSAGAADVGVQVYYQLYEPAAP